MTTIELLPYQRDVLTDSTQYKLIHGGRGSGKSRLLCMAAYNKVVQFPGARLCLVCNDYVQLRDSTLEALFDYLYDIACPFRYRKQDKIIQFPNGSSITCLTFEKDKTSLKGAEWDACLIDEGDGKNTTEEKFDYLVDGVRGKNGDRSVTVSCNPVPPGHFLAKRFFINPEPDHKGWQVTTYMNASNLPNDYIPRMEARYPPGTNEHKRWMLGELVSLQGSIYPLFSPEYIIDPTDVPDSADAILYGVDLGVNDPMVVLEGRLSQGGILYITDEYYQAGLDIIQHLPYINKLYKHGPLFSDHSATQHSIMLREGYDMVKAYKDVQEGIQMVQERFNRKTIRISSKCEHLISELYQYCWKELPNSPREEPEHKYSHAPDALRYMVAGVDKDYLLNI